MLGREQRIKINSSLSIWSKIEYDVPQGSGRKIDTQINKLHERDLRLVYKDKSSSLRKLLERDKSVTIDERYIQVLLTGVVKIGVAPEIMTEILISERITA